MQTEAMKQRHEEFISGHTGGDVPEIVALLTYFAIAETSSRYVWGKLYGWGLSFIAFPIALVVELLPILTVFLFPEYALASDIYTAVLIIFSLVYYLVYVGEAHVPSQMPSLAMEDNMMMKEPMMKMKEPMMTIKEQMMTIKEPMMTTKEPMMKMKEPMMNVKEPMMNMKAPMMKMKGEDETLYRKSLAMYRAFIMLGTVISILAVDFKFFPRKFAKTEEYGISLMDIGVGSFVISSALSRSTTNRNIGTSLLHIIPIVLVGFIRYYGVKALHYQEHVTEYGVHWNFFFTLAILKLVDEVIRVSSSVHFYMGVFLLGAYEVALHCKELTDYVFHAARVDFFSANREGIISLVGYIALYWISLYFAEWLRVCKQYELQGRAWTWAIYMLALFYATSYVLIPSRRLMNAGHVIDLLFINSFFFAVCVSVCQTVPFARQDWFKKSLTHALSSRMLTTFLLANGLVFAVNANFVTIQEGDCRGRLIVAGYTVAICLFTLLRSRLHL